MTEGAEPLPLEEPLAGLLSRAVGVRLRLGWELAALASLVVLGAGMRFWDLGSRALHHDESVHGFTAWKLFQGQGYTHEPWMHGPFQFFGTALTFVLTGGASDYTVRVFPALFGVALIILPFFFRHRLGSLGALFASGLIAFSPTLLYFSRFARNDIYIAVFTLGIVISLWRYIDQRKPLYLYLGAGLLGLSFATKENTFLHVALLLVFLNLWLAADLTRQSRRELHMDDLSSAMSYLFLYLPWAWALAALWPFIRGFRERLGLRELHPAADFLIILGTLSLPQFAAGLQVPLEGVFGVELDSASAERAWGIRIVVGLIAATAVVGLGWNWRVWAIAAAAFYIPYALLYTSFLTDIDGFASGIWGSLDYWLDQQDVRRGDQPWFYYLMLLPTYEFLALIIAAPALFYYALKGDIFRRFLVFWAASTFIAYTLAGEKMPWLSVHTTLPVVILAAYALGDVFSRLPSRDRLQRIVPHALPLAAALGLAAAGFAAFGPSSERWVGLRVLLVLAALVGIVSLLRPYDRRRLAAGLAAAALGALSLFTVRAGIVATYENGDVPRELLVYTQTSPDVPDIMERIQEAGRVSGRGKGLPIFVDTYGAYDQPWRWYLRDYTNVNYGSGAGLTPDPDTVVLLAVQNEASMQPYLDQYQTPIRYPLRWWFPEGGHLGGGGYRDIRRESILEAGADFLGSMFRGSTWTNWWRYFRDREPPGDLGFEPAVAYFPIAYPVEAPPLEPAAPSEPLPPPAADAEGRLVLGQVGSQPGAFSDPTGLAVDSDGNLYVADTGNHRIQMFDAQGVFIKEVGAFGPEPGQFNQPADVAIDPQGNIYIADTWNHRIQVFDHDLNFVTAFGAPAGDLENPEPDQMWGPRALEVDSDGNILVADTGTHRIKKFSPDGEVLDVFGERGSGDGQFIEPVGLAIAANGDVWVADVGNARIQRFDPDFNFLASYAIDPWGLLEPLNKPYLAPLPDGRLLTSDAPHGQLLLLSKDGAVIASLTELGGSTFTVPRGVAFDERGFVYITEPGNGQVLRFPLSDLPAP